VLNPAHFIKKNINTGAHFFWGWYSLLFSAQPRLSMWDWPTSHFATCYICSITKHQAFLIFFNFQFSRVYDISWGCLTSPTFFFWLQWANLIGPSKQKSWNYGGSPKQKILWKDGVPLPLAHLYRWEGGRTLGIAYSIKARCYWEHPWETHWELRGHIGNPLGTCREDV